MAVPPSAAAAAVSTSSMVSRPSAIGTMASLGKTEWLITNKEQVEKTATCPFGKIFDWSVDISLIGRLFNGAVQALATGSENAPSLEECEMALENLRSLAERIKAANRHPKGEELEKICKAAEPEFEKLRAKPQDSGSAEKEQSAKLAEAVRRTSVKLTVSLTSASRRMRELSAEEDSETDSSNSKVAELGAKFAAAAVSSSAQPQKIEPDGEKVSKVREFVRAEALG